jgi:predicted nucleic acid-binding protein
MKLVVTDTGPLLHLHEVGFESLLVHLGDIHLTPTVWAELQRHAPTFRTGGLPSWMSLCQPSPTAVIQANQWLNAQVLHAGEAEALAYAREAQADMFLTDDTAARTLGESLGIHVRGSLGVVLFAAASGRLDRAGRLQILDDLKQHSTLWMSAKVRAAARQAVSQIFGLP